MRNRDSIALMLWPFLLLLLSGCGFHLKGYQQAASPVLDGLYVVGGERQESLAGRLYLTLRTGGINLAASEETARARVEITGERLSSRVLAVDAGGKALDSEFRFEAGFRLTLAAGGDPHSDTLELVRLLSYSGADELGRRNEAALLTSDLKNEMANLIIRRLESLLRQP